MKWKTAILALVVLSGFALSFAGCASTSDKPYTLRGTERSGPAYPKDLWHGNARY